ncbi:MAG: hypothetical protein WBC73_20430 [Phormidesmis sp.]
MTSATFSTSLEAQQAAILLDGYHFELGGHDARQWVSLWLAFFRPAWIRDAVVEALYQGRYKSVSVRQILELWQRRGKPIRHVTHEFEAAVCREFGEVRIAPAAIAPTSSASTQRPAESSAPPVSTHVPTAHASVSRLPTSSTIAKKLGHELSTSVSFNLSALPRKSSIPLEQLPPPKNNASLSHRSEAEPVSESKQQPTAKLDNRAWRDFPSYTTPTYAALNADEPLNKQNSSNGVSYSSARAIQPFQPALPFSAKTLRLAKQTAISQMN